MHHDDEDTREVRIITDDERPFVMYGEKRKKSIARMTVKADTDDGNA